MFKHIVMLLGEAFCLLNIFIWPVNKYEWMYLENKDQVLPIDESQGFYSLFAVAPLLLFALLFFFLRRGRKLDGHIVIFILLLLFWGVKYHTILFSI